MQDRINDFLVNTPYAYPVFFIAMWCFVSLLISILSGWYVLSRRFRKQSEPYRETRNAGPFFYAVYTRCWSHYSSVIRVTAAEDALYLSVLFLFRVGHPPLCIPWTEIEISRTRRFWRDSVVLTLGEQERIPMRISERMARNLRILNRIPEASGLSTKPNCATLSESFIASRRKKPD